MEQFPDIEIYDHGTRLITLYKGLPETEAELKLALRQRRKKSSQAEL
jgi:hypothetical protein